ncbi:hypothetical protein WA026_011681 [Henosepilachna vigintioctopunctata]|uniref:KANL2-like probable zinc-finger domain-containing protein n=1 Tax=Henosepilachna vigintioctopunctata TaxID=420089 RepID=A0AAW1UIA0_9CUCU
MFSSHTKSNQRYNGNMISSVDRSNRTKSVNYLDFNRLTNAPPQISNKSNHYGNAKYLKSSQYDRELRNNFNIKSEVKEEIGDEDIEENITAHSIIGLGNEKHFMSPWTRKKIDRATHHETLQRIENDIDVEDVYNHYQQNWFSSSLERFNVEDRSREERIEITRHELRRHLHQIMRSNLGQPNRLPAVERKRDVKRSQVDKRHCPPGYDRLVAPRVCDVEECHFPALPCARHCSTHIMCNPEQVLFSYCTAKFADNTQCSVPVFDITHELPLCPEHARKRDNYKLYQEAKPKKLRKKVKPSAMIRPQKRNKKKKKIVKPVEVVTPSAILETPIKEVEVEETIETESPELVEDMHIVDQVLGLNEADGLEHLTEQASHILGEADISTVLSTIHVDEFSDFFAVNRNGEFEQPSREEAEELEKALAEVDNDVKSLEKLSQTHGLLDSLLDEHALADVFHNGYATCGDSMVAQTSSYLLPVEPHSHS